MASQDGQPDRILRGCTQPTLAQDLPEPAARPRQASPRAASVAGSWRQRRRPVRVRAVARPTNSASATASRGLLYQQVTEQRQQNPDSRLKWETVEAAYKETLQRFQRRTTRSSRGWALPAHSGVAAPWLHSRTGQEGQLRGTSPTWTHLPARDTRPRSCRISGVTCGGRRSCRQVSSSRQASSQRSGRQAPSQPRQPPQLPASFQALSCQTPQRP